MSGLHMTTAFRRTVERRNKRVWWPILPTEIRAKRAPFRLIAPLDEKRTAYLAKKLTFATPGPAWGPAPQGQAEPGSGVRGPAAWGAPGRRDIGCRQAYLRTRSHGNCTDRGTRTRVSWCRSLSEASVADPPARHPASHLPRDHTPRLPRRPRRGVRDHSYGNLSLWCSVGGRRV
jgi:hypothetical protein